MSVSRMIGAGHRVVFEPGGSYVEDLQSRETMALREKSDMFFLKLWTKNPERGF